MVVQRFALTYEGDRVPLLPRLDCFKVPRWVAWLCGMGLYGVASVLKLIGFNLGPLTILASVFTTLIIFNLLFARWLLKEEITRAKVFGCCLVLLGAIGCTAGTPSCVATSFTPDEVEELVSSGGAVYLGVALTAVVVGACTIALYERRYHGSCARASKPADGALPASAEPAPASAEPALASAAAAAGPPAWLAKMMEFIYPGALGLDESLADACLRAFTSVLASGVAPWGSGTCWLLVLLGASCATATSVWIPMVYRRFETTVALPIEYGALNVFSIVAGLSFFQEAQYMQPWQLGCVLGGAFVIALGISVPRIVGEAWTEHPAETLVRNSELTQSFQKSFRSFTLSKLPAPLPPESSRLEACAASERSAESSAAGAKVGGEAEGSRHSCPGSPNSRCSNASTESSAKSIMEGTDRRVSAGI